MSNRNIDGAQRERALFLVSLLSRVASAAFWLADNSEDDGSEGINCQRGDFDALSKALDLCDELPELPGDVVRDGWLRAVDELRALLAKPAEQHQGEPVAAFIMPSNESNYGFGYVDGTCIQSLRGYRDHLEEIVDSIPEGPLYTRPAEQPVLASDQWPKLEKPALVGAGRFSIGLSARLVVEAAQRHYEYETTPENETLHIATGENFLALLAQLEQLRGLRPAVPPRPPEGNGLPRYGLRWNGPQQPLATPMDDGYWTPWHLANELRKDGERYRWLRSRDLETINQGGVFAGITPQNMVLNEETLDEAVDAAMAKEVQS